MARLAGQNNARDNEGGTEYGIEGSYEEGFQDSDGIATSSKAVMMVSHKQERKLKAIQRTEEFLIDVDGGRKEKHPLKENELILHYLYHTDLLNET